METKTARRHYKNLNKLKAREIVILDYLANGFSRKEIAQQLNLAIGTIGTHILNIYSKLGVNRQAQAIIIWNKIKGEIAHAN